MFFFSVVEILVVILLFLLNCDLRICYRFNKFVMGKYVFALLFCFFLWYAFIGVTCCVDYFQSCDCAKIAKHMTSWFVYSEAQDLCILFMLCVDTGPLFTKPTDVLNTVRSRKASKPRDSCLDFSNRSEIWQAPRHQRCRDTCQISERYDHDNIQSCGFKTSRDLTVRRPPA